VPAGRRSADGEVVGGGQGVGVVIAENPSAPGEDVFGHGAGRLVLAQRGQVNGEVVGGGQGVGVVVAEDPSAPRESVLVEAAGAFESGRARVTAPPGLRTSTAARDR
jgi:hypothetical protein